MAKGPSESYLLMWIYPAVNTRGALINFLLPHKKGANGALS